MKTITMWMLLALPMVAGAQEAPATESPAAEAKAAAKEKSVSKSDLLRAIELPATADRARKAGVPEAEVDKAVKAGKGKDLSAEDMADVLDETATDVEENGPIDNFGAFVQTQLDEGKRGQDLAAAIKAEHVARGKGKGHGKAGEHGKPEGKGKPEDAGKPEGKGKPEDAGKPEGKGKPEASGTSKPEDAGKPEGKGKPDGAGKSATKTKPAGKGGH